MNRLTEIANKYNTDKGTNACADNGCRGHGFTEFYFDYYKGLKHPIILEIGVFHGASIKMYNEFFNGDCEIYCIDIDKKCDVSRLGNNIHFYLVDQGNEKQLSDFVSNLGDVKFDIILDDGSHIINHQMLTYLHLRKLLKEEGMYIMEDLHANFGEIWPYNANVKTTTLDFFTKFVPYDGFSKEINFELLNEIKTVELFSNFNNSQKETFGNLRKNRSITAIIKLRK